MPDTSDYERLGWRVAHPEEWTKSDLAAARSMLADQRRAVEGAHPKDVKNRRSLQEVVDQLETALGRTRPASTERPFGLRGYGAATSAS